MTNTEQINLSGYRTVHFEDNGVLHERRLVLGLTQKQVAERANIPFQSYQRFESGERKIRSASFSVACRVLEALEMDISNFYHGDYVFGESMVKTPNGMRYEYGKNSVGVEFYKEED